MTGVLSRIGTSLDLGLRMTAGLLFLGLGVLMSLQIIGRYGFHSSLPWADELTRVTLLWFTFLAVPVAFISDDHAEIDLVSERLGKKLLTRLHVGALLISVSFLAFISWTGFEAVRELTGITLPATGFPATIKYLAVPVGASISLVVLLFKVAASRHEEEAG